MDDHRMDAARYFWRDVSRAFYTAPPPWALMPTAELHDERGKEMPKPVTIGFVLNGFTVTVGCQTLVFNSLDALSEALRDYLKSPKRTEERYIKDAIHSEIMFPELQPRTAVREVDGPEPAVRVVMGDAHGGRPSDLARGPDPGWQHIVRRLDAADERLGHVERDLDRRVDHNSIRLDALEAGQAGIADRLVVHGGLIEAEGTRYNSQFDRIAELEGVLDEVGLRVSRLDGEPRGD